MRGDGLTEEEGVAADALVAAWNAFAQLERDHPDELSDFRDAIHRAQYVIAARIARRHYPDGWPKVGA